MPRNGRVPGTEGWIAGRLARRRAGETPGWSATSSSSGARYGAALSGRRSATEPSAPPQVCLKPPVSASVIGVWTGCLSKCAIARPKSSMSSAARSRVRPCRTKIRCTATSARLAGRVLDERLRLPGRAHSRLQGGKGRLRWSRLERRVARRRQTHRLRDAMDPHSTPRPCHRPGRSARRRLERSHCLPSSRPSGANIGSRALIWSSGGGFSFIAADRISQNCSGSVNAFVTPIPDVLDRRHEPALDQRAIGQIQQYVRELLHGLFHCRQNDGVDFFGAA